MWCGFSLTPESSFLDVGGTPYNWSLLSERPRLVFLNLSMPTYTHRERVVWVIGDGRSLPFKDRAFDLAYSNSIIEHLGSFENQHLFAAECGRVGRGYYVQTLNKVINALWDLYIEKRKFYIYKIKPVCYAVGDKKDQSTIEIKEASQKRFLNIIRELGCDIKIFENFFNKIWNQSNHLTYYQIYNYSMKICPKDDCC